MAGNKRRGLSLLELVLALSIAVVVIGLVTAAIRFQMLTFEQRRDRVEEAALARAILRNISDDLRSAVAFRPVDLQGVDTATANASEASALPTDAASDPTATGGTEATTPMTGTTPPMTGASGTAATDDTATKPAAAGAAYVAGLYGDQYSLQFDMSQLPRLDEYQTVVVDDGQTAITQIPTDIRTVSYYLAGSTPITQTSAAQARATGVSATAGMAAAQNALLPPEGKGLVRQERDRSVASYSNVAVDLSDLSQDTGEELLADEVTRLEFRYFDGYEWWPDWDSDVRGGLPMAIEILIGMLDRAAPTAESSTTLSLNEPLPTELIYRLVVRIPTGEPLDPSLAGMTTTEEQPAAASAPMTGTTPATSGAMP